MALVVGTNSYLSIADADAILALRTGAEDWDDAEDPDKEKALATATLRLDQRDFQGFKSVSGQALQWPRSFVKIPGEYGNYYDSAEIPQPIKLATAELALALIKTPDLLDDTGLEGFDSLSTGETSLTLNGREAGRLPAHVERFLRGLTMGGRRMIRLVRG